MTSTPRLIGDIGAKKNQNENGATKSRQTEGLEAVVEAKIVYQRGLMAKMTEIEPGSMDLGKLRVSRVDKG